MVDGDVPRGTGGAAQGATEGARLAKDGARRAKDGVEDAHDRVGRRVAPWADNRVFHGIARAGFAVTGLVYVLIGWTAIRMALGVSGGDDADQAGAVKVVDAVPGGVVVLWIGAAALVGLAAWYVVDGIAGSAGSGDGRERVRYLGAQLAKAIAYGVLAATVLSVVLGGEPDTEEAADDASAQLMQSWVGTALLIVAALVIIVVGIGFVVVGVRRKFVDDLDLEPVGRWRNAVVGFAVTGYLARGAAFLLIGTTFIAAVIARRPDHAAGMSGALQSLIELPFGSPVLVAVGLGLIIAGVATMLRAWLQDM